MHPGIFPQHKSPETIWMLKVQKLISQIKELQLVVRILVLLHSMHISCEVDFENKNFKTSLFYREDLEHLNKAFPRNREEINQVLKEAESIFCGCLTSIETINLGEIRPHYPMTVIGSYKKFGPFQS